jgi:hypothetical protein
MSRLGDFTKVFQHPAKTARKRNGQKSREEDEKDHVKETFACCLRLSAFCFLICQRAEIEGRT